MSEPLSQTTTALTIKPLADTDHEAVIALDQLLSHHSRRGFFEKRWQAMARSSSPQCCGVLWKFQRT